MSEPHEHLIALGKQFDLKDFVETGTQKGVTFRAVRESFDRAFTIEMGESLDDCVEEGKYFYFRGSSGERLAEILQTHEITRALFWLDAHGNETYYRDDGNNQVPKELDAITAHAPDSLVVVDDITFVRGERWVNTSYGFVVPSGWYATYVGRRAILHRGGYNL
jgi:hypothetical protein